MAQHGLSLARSIDAKLVGQAEYRKEKQSEIERGEEE